MPDVRGRGLASAVAVGVLLAIVAFMLPTPPVRAEARAEPFENIPAYDVVLTIATDGTLHVRETITYDFDRGGEHGIVRRVPYRRGDRLYDIRAVRTSSSTGAPARARTRKVWHDLLISVGDRDRMVRGRQAYVIEYTVIGAFTPGRGYDELFWDAIGTSWDVPIREAAVRVEAPVPLRRVRCRSGTREAGTGCLRDRDGPYAIDFTQSELRPHESMRIKVLLPRNVIAVPAPRHARPHWAGTWAGTALLALALLAVVALGRAESVGVPPAGAGRRRMFAGARGSAELHGAPRATGQALIAAGAALVAADVADEIVPHGLWALSVGDPSLAGFSLVVVGTGVVCRHRFR
jgi:hypothetical protein